MGDATTNPRSVAELVAAERRGARLKFLFFWGHRPQTGGGVGPGCLSQWWPARFTVDGVAYATAEHYMMAGKARLFGHERMVARILDASSPGEAKALGRQVRGFAEDVWARHRFDLVVAANRAKFGQHPELLDYLRGTGRRILVEASPVDRVWGIGLAADDERAASPSRWRGENLLGFALMAVRDERAAAADEREADEGAATAGDA
ncbi:NADAR family protein [Solihabitans fulvus]|uniref:NADAR family protein n=1 Tax=Solihabitans fulvus TaxID=1892852 RepID=A0A5B2XEV4_9PSEU|nr:NADAR family protein [Solihabitans fulvus]KAA2262348.1 NADAR family protein [Solihabitans fulvus]